MIKRLLSAALARQKVAVIDTAQLSLQHSELERLRAEIDRLVAERAGRPSHSQPVATGSTSASAADTRVDDIDLLLFKDLPQSARRDIQFFDRLYKFHGPLRSTADFSSQSKLDAELHFHFREKAEVALTAGSSWYGGDYFEFGAGDLNTFRNMLTAYDICGMTQAHTDVRFYAFDIFGSLDVAGSSESADELKEYFAPYTANGNQIKTHEGYLDQHGLFRDKCFLNQGLFQNTLTKEFKEKYLAEKRDIGFAFLDCNMGASYKIVFEFIFDMMRSSSYIYMDEYLQNPSVIEYFEQFSNELRNQRNIGAVYVRNAGGFGGLFRLYPLGQSAHVPLSLSADSNG